VKQGPNGHGLAEIFTDLYALPISLLKSQCVLGGRKFSQVIRDLLYLTQDPTLGIKPSFGAKERVRKLAYFPDKEDKTRVIAQLDYFSQTVLRPLHLFLNEALSRIPQDRTYSQGAFMDILDKGSGDYYSIDLTAATDRFPVTFIQEVLKGLLPEHYVNN
jgi:hypothetical protein